MKFGIIKERKNPPDKRVVFSPDACVKATELFPGVELVVEGSDIRVFRDADYKNAGIEVTDDVSGCDVLLGVKEVPVEALIPDKKYFFFSHTIKKQPYNRKLLQAVLDKNIELYDHEVITGANGQRLVAFGRYAGIVGAYNGIRAYGLKSGCFELPKAETLPDRQALINVLKDTRLPGIKIVLTGKGRVGGGAKEILDAMGLREVGCEDYLKKTFSEPVYCQIDVLDYNKRKDGRRLTYKDFYENPRAYDSDFMRFARVTDLYMAGHFYGEGAPYIFTQEDAKSPDFKIRVVADISCDINGPVASTIRASTIADPVYGYDPGTGRETDFREEGAIAVMAVDNLPCELPRDASEGFGEMFTEYVMPAFFNGDEDGILERARMTHHGKLTDRYSYLQDYVEGEIAS
ncbi:NAD(P)-dependent oxidoreductase [Sinomicrobium weinanense]|uniref:Saccharopine dehydrogenase [NAD(+), L-lysine-forming] n=1 Tax=Sinomicrobium weinanense TaxID=2842200 RepID=A0A926JQQ7_9FLAO|nr:NAD(P)-dependent oxidoreductase [Sinomicrobium weinanense]MBC9795703.1 alanine dehydrogenase [Sinomicrobium weinanense]MBU3125266.1 NAD(P)-dependent oxidoreductase [Sinomicrobium weinanense]